jgi:ankyrin repeat protein
MYASKNGHLDIVQYLVSKGANIKAKNKHILSHSSL